MVRGIILSMREANINKKDKLKFLDYVYILVLTMLAISNTDPRFLMLGIEKVSFFVLLVISMILMSLRTPNFLVMKREYALRFCFAFLMFVFPLVLGSSTYANRYLHLSGLILYFIIFDIENKKVIFKWVTMLLIIWSMVVAIPTIVVCSTYPYAARIADVTRLHQIQGVGGYAFIYSITIGTVLLFSYLINVNGIGKLHRISLIGIIIIYLLTIYKSNFMTAIMIAFIGCIIAVLCKKMDAKRRVMYIFVVGVVAFIVVPLSVDMLGFFIQRLIPDAGRIAEIFRGNSSIFDSILQEFIGDRLPTWQESFKTISEHPIGGIIGNESIGFGQHSTVLDTIAIWGIPFGLLYLLLVFKPFFKTEYRRNPIRIPLLVSFFILSWFNNIEATSSFVVFVIGFYIVSLFSKKKSEN